MNRLIPIILLPFFFCGCYMNMGPAVGQTFAISSQQAKDEKKLKEKFRPKLTWISDTSVNIEVTVREIAFVPTLENIDFELTEDEIILKYSFEIPNPKDNLGELVDEYRRPVADITISYNIDGIPQKDYKIKVIGEKIIKY